MCDILKLDGFDDCISGLVSRFGADDILCYDTAKIIDRLMADGMSDIEAIEYFNFNILGAWVGETTPCFIDCDYDIRLNYEQI